MGCIQEEESINSGGRNGTPWAHIDRGHITLHHGSLSPRWGARSRGLGFPVALLPDLVWRVILCAS